MELDIRWRFGQIYNAKDVAVTIRTDMAVQVHLTLPYFFKDDCIVVFKVLIYSAADTTGLQ